MGICVLTHHQIYQNYNRKIIRHRFKLLPPSISSILVQSKKIKKYFYPDKTIITFDDIKHYNQFQSEQYDTNTANNTCNTDTVNNTCNTNTVNNTNNNNHNNTDNNGLNQQQQQLIANPGINILNTQKKNTHEIHPNPQNIVDDEVIALQTIKKRYVYIYIYSFVFTTFSL